MLRKLPLMVLMILLFGCHDFDPMEDVMITINYDLFETFVSFRFVDAETGDLIGAKDLSYVSASFSGKHAEAVLTQVGERPESINSVFGLVSITLNPFEPYQPTEDKPIEFTLNASAEGFADASFSISVRDTGYFTYSVIMPRESFDPLKASTFKVNLGILEEGQLEKNFEVVSPDNQMHIHFPEGAKFLDQDNHDLTGEITLDINNYQDFTQTNLSDKKILNLMEDGEIKKAVIKPLALVQVNIYNSKGVKVRFFSGDNYPEWIFSLPSWDDEQAAPDVWSFDEEAKAWIAEGKASVSKQDTNFFGSFPLPHLTFLAAGTESDTREVSGQISIQFAKPFITDEFNGEALIANGQTGEIIHQIPLSIAEKSYDLSFFVPANEEISIKLRALGSDYEFAAEPVRIDVHANQTSFEQQVVLKPLKCRFTGVVKVNLTNDFPYFPVPSRLRIRNSNSGSTIKTLDINIDENSSDYSFFLMLPDDIPLGCSLESRTLANDFVTSGEVIQVNSSCQDNQFLNFDLSSTSCTMSGSFDFQPSGEEAGKDVQVRIMVSRQSDNRSIHNKIVTLTRENLHYTFNFSVPQNTPVVIHFETVDDDNPLIFNPEKISLNNPCNGPINQAIEFSSTMIRLSGTINFTKDAGITASELPIKIAYLDWSTEQIMRESTHNLKLSDPKIDYSTFVADAPLFIRVTRNDPNGLFVTDPYILRVPDPGDPPSEWQVHLIKTERKLIHATLKVVCPAGEIRPTVQGYFRIPGEEWKELFIIAGNLIMQAEMHATYEVGMILDNKMTDSTFTVTSQNITMTFELDPADCEKMGWGK